MMIQPGLRLPRMSHQIQGYYFKLKQYISPNSSQSKQGKEPFS